MLADIDGNPITVEINKVDHPAFIQTITTQL
jgi:hypothetical protein